MAIRPSITRDLAKSICAPLENCIDETHVESAWNHETTNVMNRFQLAPPTSRPRSWRGWRQRSTAWRRAGRRRRPPPRSWRWRWRCPQPERRRRRGKPSTALKPRLRLNLLGRGMTLSVVYRRSPLAHQFKLYLCFDFQIRKPHVLW